MGKRRSINLYDITLILFFAAVAVILIFCATPRGQTCTVSFTVSVPSGDTGGLSVGDTVIVGGGGILGTVSGKGEGYVEFTAGAERRGGMYFSGGVYLRDGKEYEMLCGDVKLTGTLHRITEVTQ